MTTKVVELDYESNNVILAVVSGLGLNGLTVKLLALSTTDENQKRSEKSRIIRDITALIFEDVYIAGYSERVYDLTQRVREEEARSLLCPPELSIFWKSWWLFRISDLERELQSHRRLMTRRYNPNRTIDRAVLTLHDVYFEVLALWPGKVVGMTYSTCKWYVWVAEWIREKLGRMSPIDLALEKLSKFDGLWPEVMRRGAQLNAELVIMQRDIYTIRTGKRPPFSELDEYSGRPVLRQEILRRGARLESALATMHGQVDFVSARKMGNDWVRRLSMFQEPPEVCQVIPVRQTPVKW